MDACRSMMLRACSENLGCVVAPCSLQVSHVKLRLEKKLEKSGCARLGATSAQEMTDRLRAYDMTGDVNQQEAQVNQAMQLLYDHLPDDLNTAFRR